MAPSRGPNEQGIAGGEVQDGRKVREIAGPVGPGGHEAGEVAKGALAPHVKTAFIGISRGEFEHGEGERRIEAEPGSDPDDDRAWARGRGGGDPAQADAGDDIEKDQVAKAHHLFGAVRIFGFGDGDTGTDDADAFGGVRRDGRVQE